MERLTKKNETNALSYSEEEKTQSIIKLSKYEDLEEQIGCPLEVRCKLYEGQVIYDRNNRKYRITHLYKRDFMTKMIKTSQDTIEHIWFNIPYENYKKTWWLKEDRSE